LPGIAFKAIVYRLKNRKSVRAVCVGFYNVENLFDTIDQPEVNDAEFTPGGSSAWNTVRYNEKLNNLATVIFGIATDITPDGLAVLGLSEIENRQVVEDLLKTAPLNKREYAIVHYDSPDRRGVDVGLIYQPKYYKVTNTASYRLTIKEMPDFLSVTNCWFRLSGWRVVHFIVNHWPSRRGESKPAALAQCCR
jgi:predicted extracellular nuclease